MTNPRITAGKYKNTILKVPDSARPAMEKVKLALFSILDDQVVGAECLDLFAGTGSLGFEALSRGAKSCKFVENDYFAIKCLNENVENIKTHYPEGELNAEVIKLDVLKFLGDCAEEFDLIFVDPPYEQSSKHLFKIIDQVLKPNGQILYLNDHQSGISENLETINPNLKLEDSRKYGTTYIDIIKNSQH